MIIFAKEMDICPLHNDWFEDWFNSPYYHMLYKNRDQCEAGEFMDHLIELLDIPRDSRLLDLACGKGRHAVYLNKKGYDVTGIDLSPASIEDASKHENERLHFYVHDMRKLFRTNYFDVILNLFTSFGYFGSSRDDQSTINAVCKGLKEDGIFVLDFFNSRKVIATLIRSEEKTANDIVFHITREVMDGFIVKHIRFNDKGKEYHFAEKVKALSLENFRTYFAKAGLNIIDIRGSYQLEKFDADNSDRLILIAKKTK
jgi:SAM-dependent methyltransferase